MMSITTVVLFAVAFQASVDNAILLDERKSLAQKPAAAVEAGLEWLRIHQEAEGFWSCAGFPEQDQFQEKEPSDGSGSPVNDVGVTGLAILAFLGDSKLQGSSEKASVARKGLAWLINHHDKKTGLFGEYVGNSTIYQHAIATMAIAEGLHRGVWADDNARQVLVRATAFLLKEQTKGSGWSYFSSQGALPDTSITGWCILALLSARDVGIEIPDEAFEGAREFLLSVTDLDSAATGYSTMFRSFESSRMPDAINKFPAKLAPATSAISFLLQRISVDVKKVPRLSKHPYSKFLKKQQAMLLSHLPNKNPQAYDPYYWFFGSQALHQAGSSAEKKWQRALQAVVLDRQRGEGNFVGSWDPVGPWGEEGGRVADTALVILSLQGPVRYRRVLK